MKFCEECGARLEDGALFCEECGAPADGSAQQPDAESSGTPAANAEHAPAQKAGGNKKVAQLVIPAVLIVALIVGIIVIGKPGKKKSDQPAADPVSAQTSDPQLSEADANDNTDAEPQPSGADANDDTDADPQPSEAAPNDDIDYSNVLFGNSPYGLYEATYNNYLLAFVLRIIKIEDAYTAEIEFWSEGERGYGHIYLNLADTVLFDQTYEASGYGIMEVMGGSVRYEEKLTFSLSKDGYGTWKWEERNPPEDYEWVMFENTIPSIDTHLYTYETLGDLSAYKLRQYEDYFEY